MRKAENKTYIQFWVLCLHLSCSVIRLDEVDASCEDSFGVWQEAGPRRLRDARQASQQWEESAVVVLDGLSPEDCQLYLTCDQRPPPPPSLAIPWLPFHHQRRHQQLRERGERLRGKGGGDIHMIFGLQTVISSIKINMLEAIAYGMHQRRWWI